MTGTVLFTWLHLSDIHAGHGGAEHKLDQRLVMRALSKDISEQCGPPTKPDAIFVTGDIAFSGGARSDEKYQEYQTAAVWLDGVTRSTGVPKDHVFLVPGNHDVDRRVFDRDRNVKRMVTSLRKGEETLEESLDSPDDLRRLEERLANYLEFAGSYAPACGKLFWDHVLDTGSRLKVRVVGLNTALLCQDDEDRGCLRLGKQQIDLLQSGTDGDALAIVLSHHPVNGGWLAPKEDRDDWAWIRKHGLCLFGHEHSNAAEHWVTGGGQAVLRVMSGSVHRDAGEPETHGYCRCSLLEVNGRLLLRHWPRVWSSLNKDFRPDMERTEPGREFAEFQVPHSLPAPPVLPAPPLPLSRPLVFSATVRSEIGKLLQRPALAELRQALLDQVGGKGQPEGVLVPSDDPFDIEVCIDRLHIAAKKAREAVTERQLEEFVQHAKSILGWLLVLSVPDCPRLLESAEFVRIPVRTETGVEIVSARLHGHEAKLEVDPSHNVYGQGRVAYGELELGLDRDDALCEIKRMLWMKVMGGETLPSGDWQRRLATTLRVRKKRGEGSYYVTVPWKRIGESAVREDLLCALKRDLPGLGVFVMDSGAESLILIVDESDLEALVCEFFKTGLGKC